MQSILPLTADIRMPKPSDTVVECADGWRKIYPAVSRLLRSIYRAMVWFCTEKQHFHHKAGCRVRLFDRRQQCGPVVAAERNEGSAGRNCGLYHYIQQKRKKGLLLPAVSIFHRRLQPVFTCPRGTISPPAFWSFPVPPQPPAWFPDLCQMPDGHLPAPASSYSALHKTIYLDCSVHSGILPLPL